MMKNYNVATLEDYGYKEHKFLKVLFKVLSIMICIITIIMLYFSIFIILLQSFNSNELVSEFQEFTFKWYINMFKERSLRMAIGNTFIISISATLISTVLGTLIAIGINSLETKKRSRILLLNNIPLLNADIVTGITLMIVFSSLISIFPFIFGWKTLLLAHLFFTLPYVILSVLPKLREIDPNLMDAALDLGVKPYKALLKVIIPAIKSGMFSGMLLAFTMSFDDFVVSFYTTGNGFDNLSIWIYSSIGKKSLTPAIYAFSSLLTIVTIVLLTIFNLIKKAKRGQK